MFWAVTGIIYYLNSIFIGRLHCKGQLLFEKAQLFFRWETGKFLKNGMHEIEELIWSVALQTAIQQYKLPALSVFSCSVLRGRLSSE